MHHFCVWQRSLAATPHGSFPLLEALRALPLLTLNQGVSVPYLFHCLEACLCDPASS
jgi:hypothetical protein